MNEEERESLKENCEGWQVRSDRVPGGQMNQELVKVLMTERQFGEPAMIDGCIRQNL